MLNGPMGYANAQRSLDYIRILAEFISQPEYKDVVTMFGVTNEPQVSVLGTSQVSYYFGVKVYQCLIYFLPLLDAKLLLPGLQLGQDSQWHRRRQWSICLFP